MSPESFVRGLNLNGAHALLVQNAQDAHALSRAIWPPGTPPVPIILVNNVSDVVAASRDEARIAATEHLISVCRDLVDHGYHRSRLVEALDKIQSL